MLIIVDCNTSNTCITRMDNMATIRLNNELESRLDFLAEKTGRTKSFYIRKALENNIENLEDLYLAQHRVETLGKTYTSQEAREELGLGN